MSTAPEVSNESRHQSRDAYVTSQQLEPREVAPAICEVMVEENPWAYGKRLRFIVAQITEAFPLRQPASIRVLDVGCGNGSLVAIPLARHGFDVTGLDVHHASVEHAQKLAHVLPNANFIAGAIDEVSLPLFDVAILSEVLEHVTHPKGLLQATLKHLRTGGIVLVTVPNGYGEFEVDSWIFRTLRLQSVIEALKWLLRARPSKQTGEVEAATDNHDSGHVQFFTRNRLKRIFTECSLEIVKESAGSFVCGPIVCHTIGRSRRFIAWNVRIADRLPHELVSSWYFALRRANS